jgi:hypothetical protein
MPENDAIRRRREAGLKLRSRLDQARDDPATRVE